MTEKTQLGIVEYRPPMPKYSIIPNQPKEKPLIDVKTKSSGFEWRWKDSLMDEATLSKHERLKGDTRKASFIFGKVTP